MPRYDLHFQLIDPSAQRAGAVFSFGFDQPLAVSGPQKMANRWLKLFFTSKGSHPVRRKEGTGFSSLIGGNVSAESDIEASLHLYIEDATEQLQELDRRARGIADSERIQSAQLTDFRAVRADAFEFWVELTSVSGERVQVLIPYAAG